MNVRWDLSNRWLTARSSRLARTPCENARPGDPPSPHPFDFDALARDLAAGLSRREALRRLGGALAVTLLASLDFTRAWGQGQADCAAFCNSIYPPGAFRGLCTADAAHGTGLCYQCGPAAPAGHGPVCGTATNPTNRFCCRADQVCVQSQCACPTGYTECNGQCCPTGQYCCNNGCSVSPCDQTLCTGSKGENCCVTGETCCDGACVDANTDPLNCGGCGRTCAADATCSSGRCVCGYPRIPCGAACCDSGTICLSGACATCPTNQEPCGDRCCPELAVCRGINYEIGVGQCGCPRTSAIISCGAACCNAQEQVCLDGSCTTCPGSQKPCGDRCCPETTLCTRSDGFGRCYCDVGYTPCGIGPDGSEPAGCCNDATEICLNGNCLTRMETPA